ARAEAAEQALAEKDAHIKKLESLADTDPLTGLMNRRGFEKFLGLECARIARGHSKGAMLALVDLNGFKKLNDRHGHLAGDACLRRTAEALLASVRKTDGVARLGGDEFALLLTQVGAEETAVRSHALRKGLKGLALEWRGERLIFTLSFGAAPL